MKFITHLTLAVLFSQPCLASSDIDSVKTALVLLAKEVDSLKGQNAELEKRLSVLEASLTTANIKIQTLEREKNILSQSLGKRSAEINTLQKSLSGTQGNLATLTDQVKNIDSTVKIMQQYTITTCTLSFGHSDRADNKSTPDRYNSVTSHPTNRNSGWRYIQFSGGVDSNDRIYCKIICG